MNAMWSPDTFVRAYWFAAEAHRGQLYPGTELPYLMHLSFVATEVMASLRAETGHDEDLAVQCALLHDTIEDTAVTHAQVAEAFGEAVATGVLALTKDKALPKDQQMADSLRRILRQPAEVAMVKLADRITNLQAPPHYWNREKIAGYRREAMAILETLGPASAALGARLRGRIESYARFEA